MTQQNIKALNKYIVIFLLSFFAQLLYGEIIFDENDRWYYKTSEDCYPFSSLIIDDNYHYLEIYSPTQSYWLIFENDTFIAEWNYSSLDVKEIGVIASNGMDRYSVFSNDLTLIKDNLHWATISDYGIVMKERNNCNLTVISNDMQFELAGYNYASVCTNEFFIAWNGLVEWFLVNSSGEVIESSDRRIEEYSGKYFIQKNNSIVMIDNDERIFLDEKYSDFANVDEYLCLFNSTTRRWELHDKDIQFVLELDEFVFPSSVYNDIVILYNRMTQITELYNISTNTTIVIDNYKIGERYLFVKYSDRWERIY